MDCLTFAPISASHLIRSCDVELGMYVCVCVMYVRMYLYMYICNYVCTYVRMYVYMYLCMYLCVYECMYVCVCMYICMYACMYVFYLCVLHYNYVILHDNCTHCCLYCLEGKQSLLLSATFLTAVYVCS